MADFTIKRGDTSPVLYQTIKDYTGSPVDLTGATVTFVMRSTAGIAPTTNASATLLSPNTAGNVSYTWTAQDTAAAGTFMGEFHVTLSGGAKMTWPATGYLEVTIEEDLVTPGGARLVNLGEVKEYLRIPGTDRTHDAALVRMIDELAPVVEQITGPVLQRTYTDETYDGTNWFIELRHRPVLTVSSVVEYRGPIPYPLTQVQTPDKGTIYSYMFHAPGRIVRRTVGGGQTQFPPGADSVHVTYTAGYATVPAHIRAGMKELIRVNYQQTQQQTPNRGNAVWAAEDMVPEASTLMLGFLVPGRVREMLAPSRRFPRLA